MIGVTCGVMSARPCVLLWRVVRSASVCGLSFGVSKFLKSTENTVTGYH